MKATLEAIRAAGKAARQAGKAASAAKSAFQQLVGAIRADGLEALFVVRAGNECRPRDSRTLSESESKAMAAIREAAITAYGWPQEKAAASWRHWRHRVANELSGKTIAAQRKAAREAAKTKAAAEAEARAKALAALQQELQAAAAAKTLKACKNHIREALKIMGLEG